MLFKILIIDNHYTIYYGLYKKNYKKILDYLDSLSMDLARFFPYRRLNMKLYIIPHE